MEEFATLHRDMTTIPLFGEVRIRLIQLRGDCSGASPVLTSRKALSREEHKHDYATRYCSLLFH